MLFRAVNQRVVASRATSIWQSRPSSVVKSSSSSFASAASVASFSTMKMYQKTTVPSVRFVTPMVVAGAGLLSLLAFHSTSSSSSSSASASPIPAAMPSAAIPAAAVVISPSLDEQTTKQQQPAVSGGGGGGERGEGEEGQDAWESSLLDDPLIQFGVWFAEAKECLTTQEAEAMIVSSARIMTNSSGEIWAEPSSRTVLLKRQDTRGFVFFTNYYSRKGEELVANPYAAISFFWPEMARQIRIEGRVEKVSAEESDSYFASRPRGSRVAARVSQQSQEAVGGRDELERRYAEEDAKWQAIDADRVDRPLHWGGFRVVPEKIEFWQGRNNRFHDRVVYSKMKQKRSSSSPGPRPFPACPSFTQGAATRPTTTTTPTATATTAASGNGGCPMPPAAKQQKDGCPIPGVSSSAGCPEQEVMWKKTRLQP